MSLQSGLTKLLRTRTYQLNSQHCPVAPETSGNAAMAGKLLQRDTRSMRTFMLVDAKERVAEASEIMQQNFGPLRTEFLYSA
jgi:hypothetical protein